MLTIDELETFFLDRGIVFGGKQGVDDDLHHFVDHFGEKVFDEVIGDSKVRVIIDLEEPCPEIVIDQEIISKKLELLLLAASVKKFLNNQIVTLALMRVSIMISFIFATMLFRMSASWPWLSGRVAK